MHHRKVSLDISTENFGMGYIHSQSLAEASLQNNYENQMSFLGVPPKDGSSDSQSDAKVSDDAVGKGKDNAVQSCNPGIVNDVSQHLQDAEQSGAFSLGAGRLPDDGFNWRKYGQKQVKGSEYPRSYYKCTHPNCQVKKKVERSYAGQITEIIYKGKHNHPKPNPICRSIIGSSVPLTDMSETLEDHRSSIKTESDSVWSNLCGSEEDRSTGCQPDGLERMSSTSAQTDVSDLMHPTVEKHLGELETTESMVPLSALTCHDSYDQITHDTMPLEWHDKDDKSDSKIRMNVSYLMETSSATRSSREPRVLVQTESEVDILDDGYHWRKYGQKVVKGNPNPRSYYKCTNPGCSVRKHVERAAHDLKSVITTYEGKHNHDVPVSRKSSHSSSSSGSFPSVANAQPSAVPGSSNNPEHTTGVRHLTSHFKRKLISHEYIMHSHPVGSLTDGKFEPAHRYERKLLQRLAPRHPGLGFKRTDVPPASAMANLSHELQESCQRVLTTGMVCVNMDHGAAASSASLTWLLLAQRLESMDQQATEQEQKDGAFCGTGLPTSELAHVLSPPAIGGRIMGVYQPR